MRGLRASGPGSPAPRACRRPRLASGQSRDCTMRVRCSATRPTGRASPARAATAAPAPCHKEFLHGWLRSRALDHRRPRLLAHRARTHPRRRHAVLPGVLGVLHRERLRPLHPQPGRLLRRRRGGHGLAARPLGARGAAARPRPARLRQPRVAGVRLGTGLPELPHRVRDLLQGGAARPDARAGDVGALRGRDRHRHLLPGAGQSGERAGLRRPVHPHRDRRGQPLQALLQVLPPL